MSNTYFQFKQFTIHQDRCAMKVTTDACLFGAWAAGLIASTSTDGRRLLDIGTGTGLLSLMIAQQSNLQIDAVEIDTAAAAQAIENIAGSPWKDRIRVMEQDVKERGESLSHLYDIIISNPPFYENELRSGNSQKDIAHHGEGLLLRELLEAINEKLTDDGTFHLLLPYKRIKDIELLTGFYHLVITRMTLVKQSVRHPPFRVFITGRHETSKAEAIVKNEIAIKSEGDEYTAAFRHLLKDYYLHL